MRLNQCFSLIVALSAAALATSAMAQASTPTEAFPSPPGQVGGVSDRVTPSESQANLQDRYDLAIMMLKKKMERLAREDGGQLSVAHHVSLQKDLDDVNRRYRNAARFAQR